MKFRLTVSEAEVKALNALEYAMTASGLTAYPRVFYRTKSYDLRIVLYKDSGNERVEGVRAYLELKSLLDFAGMLAAKKLGLSDALEEVIKLVRVRR